MYSHSTQTSCELANSLQELPSASFSPPVLNPSEEWISGSAIAPSLTEKWLCEIEDPDDIADLLNWTYYGHSGGWFVKSVNPETGKYAKHGQFKPSSPLEIEGKPQKYIYFCSQQPSPNDSKRPV
jgi:hypothetical protein